MNKAFIQKPAPPFSGTAVNKYGEFIDLKLSDYKGMDNDVLFLRETCTTVALIDFADCILFVCRKICDLVLLSTRFVSTATFCYVCHSSCHS